MFNSSSSKNDEVGHAFFLGLFNFSVSSVTDAEFSPCIQGAEWVGCDLQELQLSALLQEESLPMADVWDPIGIFLSFQAINLVHLKRNGHINVI